MSAYGEFLRGFLDSPRAVSAPTPSSAALAAAIAAEIDPDIPGLIVELGAGTGAVTAALLRRGVAPERLIVLEISDYFIRLLEKRFAGIAVIRGDALAFERFLPPGAPIASVVSGLPLLNFPHPTRQALIEKSLGLQGAQGRFIQLSYGWQPAVAQSASLRLSRLVVWRNFPPAFVWTYRRA